MTRATASSTDTTAGVGEHPTALDDSLARAAAVYGTPVYVLDVAATNAAADALDQAFPEPWVRHYSLKANDLPAVTAALAARGWGGNVVSTGEWASAAAAGLPASRITFEGIGKTDADLRAAVRAAASGSPLRWLAVESADELGRLSELHAMACDEAGRDIEFAVLLRLNPNVSPETTPGFAVGLESSKFGLSADDVVRLATGNCWTRGLRLRGVHVHMGSGLRDVTAWAMAGRRGIELLARLRTVHAEPAALEVVDFGGGFPAYGTDPTPMHFRDALDRELADAGLELPPVPAIEPGRVLVGAAGSLVASVLHTRTRDQGRQIVLDTGMTELIRPALYGSAHQVTALAGASGGVRGEREPVLVEGAVCESTDSFGVHELPVLSRGDLVVLHEAGAYAASFSSRYNGRPQAPEVLLRPEGTLELAERTSPPARDWAGEPTEGQGVDGRPRSERNHP